MGLLDGNPSYAQGYDEPDDEGIELLGELFDTLTRYVVFPSRPAAIAATLWATATHAQTSWEHATRLVIKSPVKRCGKSRLLDLLAELCNDVLITVNVSAAALARSISEERPPTILVDEGDTVFGRRRGDRAENAEDLRGILNAGHGRNRPYLRWSNTRNMLETCPTFAMAAIAGIGDLPDTIEDRAVVITMRWRGPGEQVEQFRRRTIPALHVLRGQLHGWAQNHVGELGGAEPKLPVEDRAADVWEPLVAVADLAGGPWPGWARDACRMLTTAAADDADGSFGERLLADLQVVFDEHTTLGTVTIIDRLTELDEAPWADYYGRRITDRDIAKLLRPYGIRSRQVWADGANRKGYHRDDLYDAWQRYAPPACAPPAAGSSGSPKPAG